MYFPFLYAKRSELLALNSMLKDHRPLGNLVPVLEPVNSNPTDLVRCLKAYGSAARPIVTIINADKHELGDKESRNLWRKKLLPTFETYPSLIPAYRCHSKTTQTNVNTFFKLFPNRNVAVIYASSGLNDAETQALVSEKRVSFHIVVNGKMTSSQQKLLPRQKFVDIRDDFNKLARNADYGGPEWFTDRHKTYASRGMGFGDYATIGSLFQVGGTTPHAVAIHASYKNGANHDIWVEHFVSDDKQKEIGDVASKFVQAAGKLVSASRGRPGEFGTNFALDQYSRQVAASSHPGLGKNKEQQIAHHICLMLDVLSGAL